MAERYFADITKVVTDWHDSVHNQSRAAMEQTGEEGAERVREIVHLKTTDWGQARTQGVGGPPRPYAGRIENRDMIDAVGTRTSVDPDGSIETRWGWADPKDYYLIQEHGFPEFDTKIEGMQSLVSSLDEAEENLKAKLGRIE
jgi:hypothetical protein